jgi:hypothetical protein
MEVEEHLGIHGRLGDERPLARHNFTHDEDVQLRSLVAELGEARWEEIAQFLPPRTARQCRDRYKNYLLDSLSGAEWTAAEDALIFQKYREIGPRWVQIAKYLTGRSGNHVKNRWYKHLCKPKLPKPNFLSLDHPKANLPFPGPLPGNDDPGPLAGSLGREPSPDTEDGSPIPTPRDSHHHFLRETSPL